MKPLKPNELRVKNIVQDGNGFVMRVVAIHDDGTVYCDFDGNEGDVWEFDAKNPCYGLELTEEILLEWGFENVEYNDYRHQIMIGTLTLYDGVAELHISDLYSVWISSAHHLQNLFHSIVGKEIKTYII